MKNNITYSELLAGKKCEECNSPASVVIHDVTRHNNYNIGYIEFKLYGSMHYYCNNHKREPIEFEGEPIGDKVGN